MGNAIEADTAKLAGLQIDLLQKIRQGNVSFSQLEQFLTLSATGRVRLDKFIEQGCPLIDEKGKHLVSPLGDKAHLAQLVLEDAYISPEEIDEFLKRKYTKARLQHLRDTMPDERLLRSLRASNYILLPGPTSDCTLEQLCHGFPYAFTKEASDFVLAENSSFARSEIVVSAEWLMMPGPQPRFRSDRMLDQVRAYKPARLPNAAEVVYTLVMYHKLRGVRLLERNSMETSSKYNLNAVSVGNFSDSGLKIFKHVGSGIMHDDFDD